MENVFNFFVIVITLCYSIYLKQHVMYYKKIFSIEVYVYLMLCKMSLMIYEIARIGLIK